MRIISFTEIENRKRTYNANRKPVLIVVNLALSTDQKCKAHL